MDERRILIVNLAKGAVGGDISNVLGGPIVSAFMNAALSRQGTAEADQRPFTLYVDEFHSFKSAASYRDQVECQTRRPPRLAKQQDMASIPAADPACGFPAQRKGHVTPQVPQARRILRANLSANGLHYAGKPKQSGTRFED